VLVSTLANQRYVFLGQRLNPIPLFDRLPPATLLRLPRPVYGERVYTPWRGAEAQANGRTGQEGSSPAADPGVSLPDYNPTPPVDGGEDMGDMF